MHRKGYTPEQIAEIVEKTIEEVEGDSLFEIAYPCLEVILIIPYNEKGY